MRIVKVKKGTVYNWGTSRMLHGQIDIIAVPDWVEPFLEYYENAKKFEKIKRLLGD